MLNHLDTPSRYRLILGSVSALLLIASLFFTGFTNDSNDGVEINDGLTLFTMGWMAFLGGAWEAVFWLANPLIVFAIFRVLLNRSGGWQCSVAALAIALSFLTLPDITASEAGGRADILSIGVGYWLWLSSMFMLAAGMIYYKFILCKE